MKLFKAGAIAYIVLGFIHLLAHLFGKPNDPNLDTLLLDMQNFKINLMGDHNLLKFYNGFSIMMGFLLASLGFQNYLLANEILRNKTAFLSTIIITIIAFIIAVRYFHILAFGFIGLSLICYVTAFIKHKKS